MGGRPWSADLEDPYPSSELRGSPATNKDSAPDLR